MILDYRLLFDSDPNPTLLIDRNDIILEVNLKAKELIKTTHDKLEGISITEIIPSIKSKATNNLQENISLNTTKGDQQIYTLKIIAASDGRKFIKLQQSKEGSINHELLFSKEKFETLALLAPIGIYVVDLDGNNLFVNKKWQELAGLSQADASGYGWVKAIYHEDLDGVKESWADFIAQKSPFIKEYRFINNKTNIIRNVLGMATELKGSNQETSGFIGIVQDITIAKQLRETLELDNRTLSESISLQAAKLLTQQTMLSQACSMANLGYWELSLDQNTSIEWSAEYKRIFDVDEEMESSDPRYFLQYTHPDDVEHLKEASLNAIRNLGKTSYEYRILSAKGNLKYIREQINTQLEDGKVNKVFGVTQDISYLKQAEIKLESSLAKEKNLNELKSKFISMASHEFRTPLTTILSSAELVGMYKEKIDQEKIDKFTGRIISSVNDLRAILEDFLSLEKLESGSSRYEPQPTNFREFINSILLKINTGNSNHEINFEYRGPETINIDTHLLKNVLINMLSNAKKYSPNREKIDLIIHTISNGLTITIKDRGIGIPLKDQENLFTRFYRASNVTGIKGTGLGLTIVKRYLSLMHGTINYVSKPGEGTTFTIDIPLRNDI